MQWRRVNIVWDCLPELHEKWRPRNPWSRAETPSMRLNWHGWMPWNATMIWNNWRRTMRPTRMPRRMIWITAATHGREAYRCCFGTGIALSNFWQRINEYGKGVEVYVEEETKTSRETETSSGKEKLIVVIHFQSFTYNLQCLMRSSISTVLVHSSSKYEASTSCKYLSTWICAGVWVRQTADRDWSLPAQEHG